MNHEASTNTEPNDVPDHTRDEVCIRNLLDASNEVIYFKDLQSRFIRVSLGYGQLHRMTKEKIAGLTDFDLFDRVHAEEAYADEQRIIATGEPMLNHEERERWHDRPDSWVASSKFPLREVDGTIIGTFGISRDVTQRVLLEQEMVRIAKASEEANAELSRVESQLRAVLNGSTDAIAQYDRELRYRYINPAGERLRGVPLADLVGRTDRESAMADPPAEVWEAALQRVLDTGEPGELEYSTIGPGGEEGWFHATLSPENDADGAAIGVLTSTRDITANKAAERALAHQAMHDSLTGLPNRYLLMDRLSRALVRMERAPGRVVLYFVDIDHFKSINDTYGHDAGDRVLVELARRLSSVARREDTVARLGGDEFVVLCDRITTDEHVREVAGRLVRTLAEPFQDGDARVQLSASVGAAVADDTTVNAADLLHNADAAMYRVKQGGRNHFRIFDPDAEHETDGQLQFEADLQRAVTNDELRLVYQPLLSLADQRVLGFEALLRWEHPDRGTLRPLEFLAVAERIGLMGPIGAWVLDTACARLAAWSAQRGAGAEPLSMAVNVSGGQLRAAGFAGLVAEALRTHGLEAGHLRLEISERALMGDSPELAAVLNELSGLGVQLAVDDFGATVNSLARLPQIPVSVVKLERFTDVTRQRGLVAAVIATAHGLGMSVVGGGIEDAAQLAELVALACDDGQGFLLGRPLDELVVERLLATGGDFSSV